MVELLTARLTLRPLVNETMPRRIAIGVVLALLVALPATAQDFQKGRAAAQRGDYVTALKEWRPLAEQGHAMAQYKLGLIYERGQGVPKDYYDAVKWFRRAAEQGHANAQYRLGLGYSQGQGVPKSYVQAYMWWSLAALDGHQKAGGFRGSVAKRMTPAQIAKAMKLAREWWAKHRRK